MRQKGAFRMLLLLANATVLASAIYFSVMNAFSIGQGLFVFFVSLVAINLIIMRFKRKY